MDHVTRTLVEQKLRGRTEPPRGTRFARPPEKSFDSVEEEKLIKRFPRLKMDSKSLRAERIIRIAYNKIRRSKDLWAHQTGYDIYRTKQGWRAMFMFKLLGEKLIQQNIDPALYVKVMARYGKYKGSKYMPHPTWLAKDKTIEVFRWVYRKERRSYELHLDWKKELNGWSELDIYASIRDSGRMLRQVIEGRGLGENEAVMMLWEELSPWFIAAYALKNRNGWKDFRKCMQFLGKRAHVRHIAYKAFRKSFSEK
jgi:hypothetical protein